MKISSLKICRKNVLQISVNFPSELFISRNKLVSSTSSVFGTGLFRREIGSIISVMFKIRKKEQSKEKNRAEIIQFNI